ncbi:hypothetical protein [Candidatus Harpocratesius sp.]
MSSIFSIKICWSVVFQLYADLKINKFKPLYKNAVIDKNFSVQKSIMVSTLKFAHISNDENYLPNLWKNFIQKLCESRYKLILLIDANNIFYSKKKLVRFKSFKKSYKILNRFSRKFPLLFYFICDRSIFRKIDEPGAFIQYYLENPRIIISEEFQEADVIILELYQKLSNYFKVKILSHDKFRNYNCLILPQDRLNYKLFKENPYLFLKKFV